MGLIPGLLTSYGCLKHGQQRTCTEIIGYADRCSETRMRSHCKTLFTIAAGGNEFSRLRSKIRQATRKRSSPPAKLRQNANAEVSFWTDGIGRAGRKQRHVHRRYGISLLCQLGCLAQCRGWDMTYSSLGWSQAMRCIRPGSLKTLFACAVLEGSWLLTALLGPLKIIG